MSDEPQGLEPDGESAIRMVTSPRPAWAWFAAVYSIVPAPHAEMTIVTKTLVPLFTSN